MSSCKLAAMGIVLVATVLASAITFAVSSAAGATTMDAAASAPSAPAIKCQVSTPVWCIIFGVSEINLTTRGTSRIWTFQEPVSMRDGPITILEGIPNCAVGQPLEVKKISEQAKGLRLSIVYSLTSEAGCQLEFLLPMKNGAVAETYRWAIRTSIEIDGQPLGIMSH